MKKSHYYLTILILIILLGGVFCLFYVKTGKSIVVKNSVGGPGKITLQPATGSYKVGETFKVAVSVDTAGRSVDGVDLLSLNYDPKVLQVMDSDTQAVGTQIEKGSLFPMYLGNLVDEKTGKINLSGIVNPGEDGFKGQGVFATVTFKALKPSQTTLSFDYKVGQTNDTNLAEHQTAKDILGSVGKASFEIK